MIDPNPILIVSLQIYLFSVAVPLMLQDTDICVCVLEEKGHVFSDRVSDNQYVESIKVHFRQKVVVALKSRSGGYRLGLLGIYPAILVSIPMNLALPALAGGERIEAQVRPDERRLEGAARLDLVDPLEEAEVGRDSRPASDDIPCLTAVRATSDNGEEGASRRLIRAEIDEDGQGCNETERRCDPHENVPSSSPRLGW